MNKRTWIGALALMLAFAAVLAGCGGKKDSGGSASSGGADAAGAAKAASAPKASGKAAPASDFTYDASADGKGVVIKRYTGKGGKVVIPGEIEGLPVVELGASAFQGKNRDGPQPGADLTAVVIPASVKKIAYNAFQYCEKLTSVTIQGSGVAIGGLAFNPCPELAELLFPDGEKTLVPAEEFSSLSTDAFVGCKKLPLAMRAKLKAMGFDEP